MRKNFEDYYIKALKQWNLVHRIIGRAHPVELYTQSLEAVEGVLGNHRSKIVVDVGAGSGLVGFAWLMLDSGNRALFVEPNAKKAAFIAHVLSNWSNLQNRSILANLPVQIVPRETMDSFDMQKTLEEECIVLSRAFSGADSLEVAIEGSIFSKCDSYKFGHKTSFDANGAKKQRYFVTKL